VTSETRKRSSRGKHGPVDPARGALARAPARQGTGGRGPARGEQNAGLARRDAAARRAQARPGHPSRSTTETFATHTLGGSRAGGDQKADQLPHLGRTHTASRSAPSGSYRWPAGDRVHPSCESMSAATFSARSRVMLWLPSRSVTGANRSSSFSGELPHAVGVTSTLASPPAWAMRCQQRRGTPAARHARNARSEASPGRDLEVARRGSGRAEDPAPGRWRISAGSRAAKSACGRR
jgi:hypothetical protein